MNYQAVPANNKPQTAYRRTGIFGRIMNTVKPRKHEPDRKKRLIDAIRQGNIELALNTGMTARDVNSLYTGFFTALILAREKGHTEIVQALIGAGADVNAKNQYGNTALMVASEKGHTEIVQALIEAGADVNVKDFEGKTSLNYATDAGIIQVLLRAMPIDRRLNIPITERDFNLTHNTDPVSLNTINEGDEYYMMNSNVNPYSRGTLDRLLKNKNPISPITRQPIVDIRRHKRANANVTLVSGGRKRTRKHRKSLKRR